MRTRYNPIAWCTDRFDWRTLYQWTLAAAGALAVGGVGYALLVLAPQSTEGSVWAWIGISYAGAMGGLIAYELVEPDPDIRIVEVSDVIRRSSPSHSGADVDEIVDAIEEAADADGTDGLCLKLNTPGGEIVPSDDIRRAVEAFDGPTVAYAEDMCASGGYLAASACDYIVARQSCHLGSIGVIGSRLNLSDFAADHGINYERYAAGEFKDAGHPFKDPNDEGRSYIQSIIDSHYELFVKQVAAGRGLPEETVRETEARVFLGEDAREMGLVDEVGDEETATDWLEEQVEIPDAATEEVSPGSSGWFDLAGATERAAYAFGAGIAENLSTETVVDALHRGVKGR